MSSVHRTVALENLFHLPIADGLERPLLHHRLDAAGLGSGAALQRVDHRHGGFALAQVAGHRFAKDLFRSGEVKNVINDLKSHAEVAAVGLERALLFFVSVTQYSA